MSEPNKRDLYSLLRESLFGGGAETAKERDRMVRLLEINRMMVSERQPKKLLAMILEYAREFTHADAGTIYLVEGDRERLVFKVSHNDSVAADLSEFSFPVTAQSIVGSAVPMVEILTIAPPRSLPC